MARWIPKADKPVGPNEHIGRRLFDEPKLFGASDQSPFDGLDLRNFEAGSDREFSIDRVGDACFNPKVQAYLTPRARAAAGTFQKPRTFHGWLTVTARKLTTPQGGRAWTLVPSPDQGPLVGGVAQQWSDDNMKQNLYHAHVPVPTDVDDQFFAYLLRDIFKGGKPFRDPEAPEPPSPAIRHRRPMTKLQRWAWGQRWLGRIRLYLWGDD
jgi:hypothetical protein